MKVMTNAGISPLGVSSPVPVVDVTVTLIHEQDVIHLILNVEGVQGHWFVQREWVIAHVWVSKSLFRCKTVHGVKRQDFLQEIQGYSEQ